MLSIKNLISEFFNRIFKSFYSIEFYQQVATSWQRLPLNHIAILCLIVSLIHSLLISAFLYITVPNPKGSLYIAFTAVFLSQSVFLFLQSLLAAFISVKTAAIRTMTTSPSTSPNFQDMYRVTLIACTPGLIIGSIISHYAMVIMMASSWLYLFWLKGKISFIRSNVVLGQE